MAALTHHSHKAILNIIGEMTRPIADILGEPPLSPLEPPSGKVRRPVPSRTKDTPSEADILAITRSYLGPNSFLKGGRLSPELTEPRKRPRAEKSTADVAAKKRRRNEEAPRPESAKSKREGETKKKQQVEDTKPRPIGIKLTSQPAPRESDESRKPSRSTNGTSLRKKENPTKETTKQSRENTEDKIMRDVKEPSRKRPSAIPLSAPPPLRSVSTEKAKSEIGKHKAKSREMESEQIRSSLPPRTRPSEKSERKRRDDTLRSSTKGSSEPSTSSSERRRSRSRVLDSDITGRDSETERTDRESDRREKRRTRDRDTDIKPDRDTKRDREIPARDRERDREREDDRVRDRERIRDRDRSGDRPQERDRLRSGPSRDERGKENSGKIDKRKETRTRDIEQKHRENGKPNGTEKKEKEVNRRIERPSFRSSVPLSKPDSGRESASGGGLPVEVRGISLSSKPITSSPAGIRSKSAQAQPSGSGLQENIAKQKEVEKEFRELTAKCEELNRNKDYDAYEEMSKRAFRRGFELGLIKEAELRLDAAKYRALSANKRSLRNRPIIEHYRALTKKHAEKWQSDFDRLGRVNAVSFFKRSTRKVYFRMFIVHHQWDKETLYSYRSLGELVDKVVKGRRSGNSNKEKEEELPTRKLENIHNIIKDYTNIISIFDGIASDFGGGADDPGAESYIP